MVSSRYSLRWRLSDTRSTEQSCTAIRGRGFSRRSRPMTTETDLLPCPFCGSADAPRLKNTHTASFWVSCSEEYGGCGAQASGQFFPGPSRRTRFCYEPEEPEGSKFYARTLGE